LFVILKYILFIIDASTPGRRNFVFCSIQFCKLLYEFASPRQVIVPPILISRRKNVLLSKSNPSGYWPPNNPVPDTQSSIISCAASP
jgi:hypothetical protein